jgi:hypothetical protein
MSEEGGTKLEKGGADDCSSGPIASRTPRDIPWIILFVVHIVAFLFLGMQAVTEGDLNRLVNGADFMGNVCGAKGQLSLYNDVDLSAFPFVMYTFNVTQIQMEVAKQTFGDPLAAVSPLAAMASGNGSVADSAAAMAAASQGGGAMQGLFPDPMDMAQDLPKYFVPICAKSCTFASPPRTAYWKGFLEWNDLAKFNVAKDTYAAMMANDLTKEAAYALTYKFQWGVAAAAAGIPAADTSECPYPSMYCAPSDADVPGYGKLFEMAEYGGAYCLPTVKSLEAGAEGAMNLASAGGNQVLAAAQGYDAVFTDIQKVWWTFIVVAFISVVVAMVYLVILRFTIGIIVWGSIVAVFLLLASGGGFMHYQSVECASEGETDGFGQRGCPESGFKMADETQRYAMQYGSYFVGGFAFIYLLLVFCVRNKVRLAIALNEVAANFVTQQPYSLAVPPTQLLFVFGYLTIWMYFTLYIVSYVSDLCTTCNIPGDHTHEEAYGIEAESWFSSGIEGNCTKSGVVPAAYLYAEWGADGVGDHASVDGSPSSFMSIWKCRRAATETLQYNYRFWFALFNLLWVNEFSIAFTQCALAGAVAFWYFAPNDSKLNPKFVIVGIKNTAIYHSGSVALGSLIVAIIQLVKYYLEYLAEQQKKAKNKLMELVFRVLAYVVWCVEKCVKFLNKNAYIQIAILGKKFCWAAKDAFWLIFRNAARIAVCTMIAPFVRKFGVLFIMVFTTYTGYQLVTTVFKDELSTPYGACFIYLIIGNVVGRLVMNVFGMAVDTSLQCFIADEELNGMVGEHTPPQLKQFLAENKDALKTGNKTAPAPES